MPHSRLDAGKKRAAAVIDRGQRGQRPRRPPFPQYELAAKVTIEGLSPKTLLLSRLPLKVISREGQYTTIPSSVDSPIPPPQAAFSPTTQREGKRGYSMATSTAMAAWPHL